MNTNNRSRILSVGCTAFLLLLAVNHVPAQARANEQNIQQPASVSTAPRQEPANATPTATPHANGDNGARSIYGLQGVLVETLDGNTVAAQAADQALNPASAVKLATALIALRTFGPRHRFTTGFWTNGSFDKATGTIHGNLYVSGRDPSFHYEHAVMIARQLNQLGIRIVTGDLVVAQGFTMNFNWSARRSGERLYDTLDSTLRPADATAAWNYARATLRDQATLQAIPSVAVMGEVSVSAVAPGARLLLTHYSSKLTDVLKVLLCYSNNFMAERLGDSIGGVESVQRGLITSLAIPPEQLRLASLSGLGVNRVTPLAMMKIFRALREELRKHKLSTTDIMPVAGIDPGTLQDRFTDVGWPGSVIAKTGTLTRTDGGASSLVGQMKTATGEILLFVILNQRGNVGKFRENQDYLIKQVQSTRGGPKAFDYKPLGLAMKLADTRSSVPPDAEEYEPVRANGNPP